MKKIPNFLTIMLLMMLLAPAQLMAKPVVNSTELPTTPANEAAKFEAMENRLREINEMDKSKLSPSEKRALRKEVRAIKATKSSSGVYLSVGAVIIIILLLILLL